LVLTEATGEFYIGILEKDKFFGSLELFIRLVHEPSVVGDITTLMYKEENPAFIGNSIGRAVVAV